MNLNVIRCNDLPMALITLNRQYFALTKLLQAYRKYLAAMTLFLCIMSISNKSYSPGTKGCFINLYERKISTIMASYKASIWHQKFAENKGTARKFRNMTDYLKC